jgi:cytochrome c553
VLNGKRTTALGAVAPLGRVSLSGALLLVALCACGGSGKGAEDASSAYEPQSTTPWKDKSREQRMDWMGIAVFPKMRKLFLEQDSEKYRDFACQTCHGNDMELVDFRMPNTLFALSKSDTLAQAKEYDEKTTDFMLGAVVPEMAKLLDMDAFTLENQSGFGCMGCHPASGD